LKQANSGDVSGDRKQVVGYGSVAFSKSGNGTPFNVNLGVVEKPDYIQTTDDDFSVSKDVQNELLNLVRQRITAEANGRPWSYTPPDSLPELLKPAAVFVTLHKNGRLRGCIGTTAPRDPLWKIVEYMAYAAAFDDPRFQPVTAAELKDVDIEISVLSPMRKIASPSEIVPGRHGVVVRKGFRSGLFLPQVWEQLPDMEQFMGYLCAEKAGLPFDAWKGDGVELLVFTVHAFAEKDSGKSL
jgi:AmmeMemoRadiSam system protein A